MGENLKPGLVENRVASVDQWLGEKLEKKSLHSFPLILAKINHRQLSGCKSHVSVLLWSAGQKSEMGPQGPFPSGDQGTISCLPFCVQAAHSSFLHLQSQRAASSLALCPLPHSQKDAWGPRWTHPDNPGKSSCISQSSPKK